MTDADLPPLNPTPPGLYRHYKGGWYEVIDTVRCSETLLGMTLYRALYGGFGLWVRPAAMFGETAEFAGRVQRRFTPQPVATLPLADLDTARALVAHLRGRGQREAQRYDGTAWGHVEVSDGLKAGDGRSLGADCSKPGRVAAMRITHRGKP